MNQFEFEEKCKKESVCIDKDNCVQINIKYPQARGKNEVFTKRFNKFYEEIATAFYSFSKGKLAKMAHREGQKEDSNKVPYGAVMTFSVSFQSEKYISVIIDISLFDTKNTKCKRFCNIWSTESAAVLQAKSFLKCDRASISCYKSQIEEIIMKNAASFELLPDCVKNSSRLFSLENFCLTPNGPAFFYQKGTLFSDKEGCPTFIVHEENKKENT